MNKKTFHGIPSFFHGLISFFLGTCAAFICATPAASAADSTVVAADSADSAPRYVKVPKAWRFRVNFTDKDNNSYSLKRPLEFLSQKALDRRAKYKIKPDEYDLPVTPAYLEYLKGQGLKVINTSRWLNSAIVEATDTAKVAGLHAVKFIKSVRRVWTGPDSVLVEESPGKRFLESRNSTFKRDTLAAPYGYAQRQVAMLGVDSLHKAGFRGEGVTIAVIDGGFLGADRIEGLKNCKILGTANFTGNGKSVYDGQSHGTMVLSCIAANWPHTLVGTAPDASFYLVQSEDGAYEQIVEEDNWCAALEYADSVGADIATSSLGYVAFDDSTTNHKYYELDGHTSVCSRAASFAASRGLLVLNSAGNSGDETWKKISVPADADGILTVGAVSEDGVNTVFSSVGNTADGRVKPDVMAMGGDTWLFASDGDITVASGTSFSTPIMCGVAACLLQACPKAKPEEIIQALRLSGNNASHPDNVYGYGIPSAPKALGILNK